MRREGAVAVRDHPQLARSLQRGAQDGVLRMLLPGVYVAHDRGADLDIRIQAAARWIPYAVLVGPAAARLTFWPDVRFATVTLAASRGRRSPAGFCVVGDPLDPQLVVEREGLRMTRAALTALDLVAGHGGAGIDEALRTRACSLADMHEALRLTPGRRGNGARRAMLHDSRDEPWSEAERLAHMLLRQARIRGWHPNYPVSIAGRRYYLDIAFPAQRVVIEIDGYQTHGKPAQFHRDRRKWSDLTAAGWRIVHLTWDQLVGDPQWVIDTIQAALAWQV